MERIQDEPIILAIQDTTVFNYTLHPNTKGLGPIGPAGLSGFLLHTCLAATPEGVPMGILAHHLWVRLSEPKDSKKNQNRPLEDKESARWINMTKEVAQVVPYPKPRVYDCEKPYETPRKENPLGLPRGQSVKPRR
ncbi:MAG: hypothetical protein M0Z41_02645 [Peptococcaceae bacterium]|nr:hypothetical protein [Peptococcaceae bacterium]